MTQEQKEKLEQAAKDYIKPFAHQLHLGADEGLIMDLVGFAKTILDNPGEWGLITIEESNILFADNMDLMQSQLAKYRKALERFATMTQNDVSGHYVSGTEKYPVEEAARVVKNFMDLVNHIAKEALKQEDTK